MSPHDSGHDDEEDKVKQYYQDHWGDERPDETSHGTQETSNKVYNTVTVITQENRRWMMSGNITPSTIIIIVHINKSYITIYIYGENSTFSYIHVVQSKNWTVFIIGRAHRGSPDRRRKQGSEGAVAPRRFLV